MMIIEVYCFAYWFGLELNSNGVIAVALTMEFTAHIECYFTYVMIVLL